MEQIEAQFEDCISAKKENAKIESVTIGSDGHLCPVWKCDKCGQLFYTGNCLHIGVEA